MTKTSRHRINALICLLVLAHAVYWMATGRLEGASGVRTALVMAEAVLGLVGAVWFWSRSRGLAR